MHVVFSRRIPSLEAVIKGEYEVSGWTESIQETIQWVKQGVETPDMLLINGLDHYRKTWKNKQNPNQVLTEQLVSIKQHWPNSRIKIFLPEEKNTDQDLLINLMQHAIYDFWFFDSVSAEDLINMISLDRNFAEVEQYLKTLPVPNFEVSKNDTKKVKMVEFCSGLGMIQHLLSRQPKDIKEMLLDKLWPIKTQQPFVEQGQTIKRKTLSEQQRPIRAGTAFFWSEDDCMLSYAIAFLLAHFLADAGYKTVLVEVPGQTPRLGATLGIRHPVWNVRNGLSQFAEGRENQFQQFVFNGPGYRSSDQAYDQHQYIKHFPDLLYFFPDGSEEEWLKQDEFKDKWEPYMISWLQWAMFHENFQFILFCGFGHSTYQEVVFKRMSYLKVIINQPWASGFKIAEQVEAMWPGQNLFIWGHSSSMLQKETTSLPKQSCYHVPDTIYKDFLNISAFLQPPDQLQTESVDFLETIGQSFINSFFIPAQKKGVLKRLKKII